jgi:hypothetical protein
MLASYGGRSPKPRRPATGSKSTPSASRRRTERDWSCAGAPRRWSAYSLQSAIAYIETMPHRARRYPVWICQTPVAALVALVPAHASADQAGAAGGYGGVVGFLMLGGGWCCLGGIGLVVVVALGLRSANRPKKEPPSEFPSA